MALTAQETHRERHWICARRISERRHALGLTQYDVVARLAGLGVAASNRTLSAMEHGQGVDVGRLPELAGALDCTITYLLGLTDDPGRWSPDATGPGAPLAPPAPAAASGGLAATTGTPAGWILGPDIPDRPNHANGPAGA